MSLLDAATAVRENAYAPYSGFRVGAALRGSDGRIYAGCNVENVAYPEGTCAEAGAIAAMVAAGVTRLQEVLVLAGGPAPVAPCGGCRQKLREFGGPDVVVTMRNTDGAQIRQALAELLPAAFDARQMSGDATAPDIATNDPMTKD